MSRPDYHGDKHTFRHHLQPETNEGLDIGTNDRRFAIGRFRQIIADTLLLGGAALILPISAANGGTGLDTSGSTGVPRIIAGVWSVPTTVPAVVGGTGLDSSGSTGLPRVNAGVWSVQSLTDGQLLIGDSGTVPVAASLTAGAGITITPGAGTIEIAATAGSHAILSATHSDTLAAAVSRGSLIYGNITPAWAELVIGAAGFLKSDGTDVVWGTINLDSDTIAGTLATSLGGTNADFSATAQGNILYFSAAGVMSVLAPGTAGYVLRTNGAGANPSWIATVLDRDVTQAEVVSNNTEVTVYSFSVPGNTLGTNKAIRITIFGDYLNNSGAPSDLTVRYKYGATTFAAPAFPAVAASASRRAYRSVGGGGSLLFAVNATNAQMGTVFDGLGAPGALTGGSSSDQYAVFGGHHTTVAEDSTVAKTLAITIQHSVSAATISFRLHVVIVELV